MIQVCLTLESEHSKEMFFYFDLDLDGSIRDKMLMKRKALDLYRDLRAATGDLRDRSSP